MKKILIIVTLIFTSIVANAQLKLGIKAGANFSTISNADIQMAGGQIDGIPIPPSPGFVGPNWDAKAIFGFSGGLTGQLKFGSFGIQPEVLFSMQGVKLSGNLGESIGFEVTTKTSYLNIPVMLQYYIIPGLNVEIGPQLGILLSAETETNITGLANPENRTQDIKDTYSNTDFAINFGAAYELPMLPVGVFGRYTLGLTNIFENTFRDEKYNNRVIQFGAFVKF